MPPPVPPVVPPPVVPPPVVPPVVPTRKFDCSNNCLCVMKSLICLYAPRYLIKSKLILCNEK